MVSIGVVACWNWLGTENWEYHGLCALRILWRESIQTGLVLICGASSVGSRESTEEDFSLFLSRRLEIRESSHSHPLNHPL